jgi:hypothetical protein
MSLGFPLFGESLETFHCLAKVSKLGKYLGIFWSNLTNNSGYCLFLIYFLRPQLNSGSFIIRIPLVEFEICGIVYISHARRFP